MVGIGVKLEQEGMEDAHVKCHVGVLFLSALCKVQCVTRERTGSKFASSCKRNLAGDRHLLALLPATLGRVQN